MAEVGSASLTIIPSFKGFESALDRGVGGQMSSAGTTGGAKFGAAAGRSAGSRFRSVFSTAAKAAFIGVGALGVGAFKLASDSVNLASDLNESLNAVNVTYGKQSAAVKKLGREAANSLGLSNSEFNALSVRFAAFSKTISGGNGKKVVGTLDDLTTRAADFASVMNLDVNEAAQIFQSGLAGESEPLRRYGLDLSAATVEQFAYANGIAKSGEELTEAQKVQARYGSLMKQTAKTAGDFANTSDSLANRQRILNARWDDARAKLGTALLPIMEDLSGWVLNKGLPAFEDFSDWFVSDGLPAIQDFAEDVKPLAESLLPAMGDALGIAKDALKEAAPLAKAMVDAFNEMPDWAKAGAVGGAAGLWGLSKLKGGKGGGIAGGGGLLRSAKPIPVYVVNDGFGGKSGKGGAVPGGKGGLVAGTMKTLGPVAVAAAAAYGAYEFSKYAKQKRVEQRQPGAAGTDEHAKKIAEGFADATFAAESYNAELERAQDEITILTNGVTGFATPAEELRDHLGAITRGATAEVTAPGLSSALSGTQVLLDRLNSLDGRQARAYVAVQYSQSGYQNIGGLQETTNGGRAGGGHVAGSGTYLVGERGPEVLRLNGRSGEITPTHQLRGGGNGGGSQRVVLDFGAGKTLTGWIQDEIADYDAFAGTRGRMG